MTVCYFGIYDSTFSRNRVYLSGLTQAGVTVIECSDRNRGLSKYWNLIKKHRALKDSYDVMIVGYPGYTVVWLARLLSRKPVVYDALCTMYEAQVLSRGIYPVFSPRWILTLFWDWVSVTFSDLVLVESEPQRRYFLKRFGLKEGKVKVLLTGADDSVFFSEDVPKRETFTAIFRGRFLREAGLPVIVEAARLLEEKNIAFLIFGSGHAEHELVESMKKWSPRNLTVDDRHLSYDEMRKLTLSCHVSLGQFASHERLSRTIPHKAYEALALKMPYITSRAEGHQGLLVDHENCLMTDAGSAQSLASALLLLKKDEILRRTLSENGYQTYLSRATPKALGETLNSYLSLLTS